MTRQGLFEWNDVKLGLLKWGLIIFNVAFWVSESIITMEPEFTRQNAPQLIDHNNYWGVTNYETEGVCIKLCELL